MAKRQRATVASWLRNQVWNTSLPWLLGLFFIGAGFYYVTNSTLAQHTADLKELKHLQTTATRENAAEREKVRDQFLQNSKETANGIAELNKTTAVMGATLVAVSKELERISTKLDTVPPRK